MLHRNRTASLLLIALVAAGCGGGKHGSTAGIPGGGTKGNGTATLSIGADVTIAKGRTHQFQALLDQGGAVDDCSATGQWTSSDPAVASVSGGTVTALGLGQTTITASCAGFDDAALLVVTDAEVDSIVITPASGELPLGLKEQLVAMATLSDHTTADVTDDVNVVWSTSNPSAFTLDPANPGVITATKVATAVHQSSQISAFHGPSGQLATVTRTVTDATLQSIVVSASAASPVPFDPLAPSVPLGVDVQFHAIGTLSDGQSADVTPSMTWTASPPGVVSIGASTGLASTLATTLATGPATITATPSGGVAPASATLVVTDTVLTSVAIDQDGAILVAGETLQLTGTGTDTQNNTLPVTLTGWTSSVAGVATVSGTGLLTAVVPGGATISASYQTPDGRTLGDTSQVTVVAPTTGPILSYVTFSPGSVKSGKKVTLTIALTARATADTNVALASSASALVPVPDHVTIPSGSTSVQLKITTAPAPKKQKVKITATLGAFTKVATLNLR